MIIWILFVSDGVAIIWEWDRGSACRLTGSLRPGQGHPVGEEPPLSAFFKCERHMPDNIIDIPDIYRPEFYPPADRYGVTMQLRIVTFSTFSHQAIRDVFKRFGVPVRIDFHTRDYLGIH